MFCCNCVHIKGEDFHVVVNTVVSCTIISSGRSFTAWWPTNHNIVILLEVELGEITICVLD